MAPSQALLLQGNEACARGAIAAGARFFAGYPISPASEIAEICSTLMPTVGGYYLQMEDEIASLAAVIGASLGGMKAFTATSGPGFSLMQENLGLAIMAEVPCVIINSQRYGLSTGLATSPAQGDFMQVRWGTHGDHAIIALAPATVQECFQLTVEAFNLAERFRSPVVVLTDAALAHLREKADLPESSELKIINRRSPQGDPRIYLPYKADEDLVPPMASYGDSYIQRVTGLVHDERGYSSSDPNVSRQLIDRLLAKIENYRQEMPRALYRGHPEPEVLVVSYGSSARAAEAAAIRSYQAGNPVACLRLRTLWPFPEEELRQYAGAARAVLVVEMSAGQLTREIRVTLDHDARVEGLCTTAPQVIYPREVAARLEEVLQK